MTPNPSTRQRFACATTSAGMLASVVFVMNDVSASVVPLMAAFWAFAGLKACTTSEVCAASARGSSGAAAASLKKVLRVIFMWPLRPAKAGRYEHNVGGVRLQ